jgi:hypothetical protein
VQTEVEQDKSGVEQLAEARSIVQKMKRLGENSDFKYLYAQMQANLDSNVASLLTPPDGLDRVVTNIYKQGDVAGFLRAMNFFSSLLEGARSTIERLRYLEPELNKEDEDQ